MSEHEKPLHVRVAEALGCKPYSRWSEVDEADVWICPCYGSRHHTAERDAGRVARYDRWWDAAGPLVEKYAEGLKFDGDEWYAYGYEGGVGRGLTPLIAVCNLLLALHAAGKLHRDRTKSDSRDSITA